MIDEFYNSYFSNLSDHIAGFGTGDSPHFVKVIDLIENGPLIKAKEKGLAYPILCLEEFDETEEVRDGDRRVMTISGAFSVLDRSRADDGVSAPLGVIQDCRQLARKVFAKAKNDSIQKSGNILYDNNIIQQHARSGVFVYNVAGGDLKGYRIAFTWEVSGKLIDFSAGDWID